MRYARFFLAIILAVVALPAFAQDNPTSFPWQPHCVWDGNMGETATFIEGDDGHPYLELTTSNPGQWVSLSCYSSAAAPETTTVRAYYNPEGFGLGNKPLFSMMEPISFEPVPPVVERVYVAINTGEGFPRWHESQYTWAHPGRPRWAVDFQMQQREGIDGRIMYDFMLVLRDFWPELLQYVTVANQSDEFPEQIENLSIYPNPAHDQATAEVNVVRPGNYTLAFHDALGREIWRRFEHLPPGTTRLPLDISGLATGVYTLRVFGSEGYATSARVVVR